MTTPTKRGGALLTDALLGVPLSRVGALGPGFALAVALGAVGILISVLVGKGILHLEKSPISPVMVGILLGMAIRNAVPLGDRVRPGLRFAATKILRLGIILLGIRLSLFELARFGLLSLPVVVVCIVFGVLFTSLIGRWFSVPARLATLIGVGTSICGVSAIAATGPVIDAEDEEVAYAIAVITVFGLLAMIVYPFLAPVLFDGDPTSVGLFLGTAVHDTSQVNGAAVIFADAHDSPLALDVAVITKLVRNLFMILIIPLMALRHQRSLGDDQALGPIHVRLARLFPLFVIGFVLMAAFRSVGDAGVAGDAGDAGDAGVADGAAFGLWSEAAWQQLCARIQTGSGWCLVVALSAVGLSTDFRAMRSLRVKPFLVGMGAALAVGVVSFTVVTLLRSGA